MEKIKFFDSNVYIGSPMLAGAFKPVETGDKLIKAMDEAGVEKSMVWHISQHNSSPVYGNQLLINEIKGKERLVGTWTVIPPQTGEVIQDGFFQKMKENNVFGLRAFPKFQRFSINRVSMGPFLDEVSERKIPFFLSLSKGVDGDWDKIYSIMSDFPYLTCVVSDLGSWSPLRNILPLMDKYPNFYVETSMLSLHEGNMEFVVKKNGSKNLLFGTGFPETYMESNTLQLIHSEISDEDKKNIATLYLERIISGVKL